MYEEAIEDLRVAGVNQWQGGYPNRASICEDLAAGQLYVAEEDDLVVAATALIFGTETTYEMIEGAWLSDEVYGTIHRTVVERERKGRGTIGKLFDYAESVCRKEGFFSLRVDTHCDNTAMKNALKKHGFVYCGVIWVEDSSPRNAYEKLL